MPLIKIECYGKMNDEKKSKLAGEMSKICASVMGKPEAYVMSTVEDGLVATMGGKSAASAFIEVKGIGGFSTSVNNKLSAEICACLNKETGISPSCVYINFTDVPASSWGWDGKTFG